MSNITKFELLDALGIYHKFSLKLIKYIRDNHNGNFQRISFADSTKFIAEFRDRETGSHKTITLNYKDFGYE